MNEREELTQKSIEIVIEAARQFAFNDLNRIHPFTKRLHAALEILQNYPENPTQELKETLDLDDSLHPTPIFKEENSRFLGN